MRLSDDYIEIGVKERPAASLARSAITLFLRVVRLCIVVEDASADRKSVV